MKRILLFVCIQFFLLASFAGETINFCKGWKFHLGDAGKGASSSSYNDSQWRILNIPHDWSIEGTYKQFENGTDWQSGFLPAGCAAGHETGDHDKGKQKRENSSVHFRTSYGIVILNIE